MFHKSSIKQLGINELIIQNLNTMWILMYYVPIHKQFKLFNIHIVKSNYLY